MYKKIIITTLLVTPLFTLNLESTQTHAATSSSQVDANIDLSYLKKNLVPGMSKSQVKNLLGNEYTEGINHIDGNEQWSFEIGKVKGYEFNSSIDGEIDIAGIKNGKLKYYVSLTFEKEVLKSIYIRYLDSSGKVPEYYKTNSGYVRDNGKEYRVNSKFIDFGDRGEQVKQVQRKLISKGFSLPQYGSDGVFGEETEIAVRAFQNQQGIHVDGIVGPITLQKLGISSSGNVKDAEYPGHLIKRGSTGSVVKIIQVVVGTKSDGIFGPKTEAAVKSFQKQHGLQVDGLVGPNTWSKMF